jgi:hypothetical protein
MLRIEGAVSVGEGVGDDVNVGVAVVVAVVVGVADGVIEGVGVIAGSILCKDSERVLSGVGQM